MATIHLVEGPVGSGKSTYAEQLSVRLRAPWLNLDEWMVTLFRPDRPDVDFMPWYIERKARCIEQIWRVTCNLMDVRSDVILELGLVQLSDRAAFYSKVDGTDCALQIHVLDVPRETRRNRVRVRNAQQGATFQMEVSDEIFELADGAWQAPDAIERSERRIQIISSD
jgi:predicted kinase